MSLSAKLALAAIASAALPLSAAGQTLESIQVLSGGRLPDHAGVSAPMTDTTRRSRTQWLIEPDDASYGLVRWHLDHRQLPAAEAIRVTSLANAFDEAARPGQPDAPHALRGGALEMSFELVLSPVRPGYHLLHLGLRGAGHPDGRRSTAFVVVAEGTAVAIPRIRDAIRAFADGLEDHDFLGLVARGPRGPMILEPTRLEDRSPIDRGLDAITGSSSPDLIAGLLAGYDMASRHQGDRPVKILLLTDGAGIRAPDDDLFHDLRRQARLGITLSVIGLPGEGYDDRLMARLAHSGDGRYAVVDNPQAARRLFSWLPDSLDVVARDVTGRIELDPETVSRYRFLGGSDRRVATGEGRSLGAGGRAMALLELQLTGRPGPLGAVRIRYRPAAGREADKIKQFEMTLDRRQTVLKVSSALPIWIAATFGEKLRGSFWTRDLSYRRLLSMFALLDSGRRIDPRTAELRYLIQQARRLTAHRDRSTPGGEPANQRGRAGEAFDQLRVLE